MCIHLHPPSANTEPPMRSTLVLINPNSSETTTAMMVGIARRDASGWNIEGQSASLGPAMITNEEELTASAREVLRLGLEAARRADVAGIIVAAFGDPGLYELRARCDLPVVGLCESSMEEAAARVQRFAVATTTPLLAEAITREGAKQGYGDRFIGVTLTREAPLHLAADPEAQTRALGEAVEAAAGAGAEAVIIGGGPLGESAAALSATCRTPVIAPIGSAVRKLVRLVEGRCKA